MSRFNEMANLMLSGHRLRLVEYVRKATSPDAGVLRLRIASADFEKELDALLPLDQHDNLVKARQR